MKIDGAFATISSVALLVWFGCVGDCTPDQHGASFVNGVPTTNVVQGQTIDYVITVTADCEDTVIESVLFNVAGTQFVLLDADLPLAKGESFEAMASVIAPPVDTIIGDIKVESTVGSAQFNTTTNTAAMSIAPSPAGRTDLNGDGEINLIDLVAMFEYWGDHENQHPNFWFDLNQDETVNAVDVASVLATMVEN